MKNIHCMQKIISFLLVWSVSFQLDGSCKRLLLLKKMPKHIQSIIIPNHPTQGFELNRYTSTQFYFDSLFIIPCISCFAAGYYCIAKKINTQELNSVDRFCLPPSATFLGLSLSMIRATNYKFTAIGYYGFTFATVGLGYRYLHKKQS